MQRIPSYSLGIFPISPHESVHDDSASSPADLNSLFPIHPLFSSAPVPAEVRQAAPATPPPNQDAGGQAGAQVTHFGSFFAPHGPGSGPISLEQELGNEVQPLPGRANRWNGVEQWSSTPGPFVGELLIS